MRPKRARRPTNCKTRAEDGLCQLGGQRAIFATGIWGGCQNDTPSAASTTLFGQGPAASHARTHLNLERSQKQGQESMEQSQNSRGCSRTRAWFHYLGPIVVSAAFCGRRAGRRTQVPPR